MKIKQSLKKLNLIKYKSFMHVYNSLFGRNKVRVDNGNRVCINAAILVKVKLKIKGTGNIVYIDDLCRLNSCSININGNDNMIHIFESCALEQAEFHIEDDKNNIMIGKNTNIAGKTHLAAIESTNIIIGEDCLFSSDVHIRTGDSHSIVNLSGDRINHSQDIVIGNHVWIGTKVICLKGTQIKDNCVVGAGSLLNRMYSSENCIIAGCPAKMLKHGINWVNERIM